jgi:hypothetical protein
MATIFEKEPIFLLERTWDNKSKMPKKHKFLGDSGKKAEVNIDSGSLGMEFFYEKTLPDFYHAGDELQWSWSKTFSKFENVLAGSYKTAWREVVRDHFTPLPAAASKDKLKMSFFSAVRRFVCTVTDSETPRDLQYVYMVPGGDHRVEKDLLTPPRKHARRFKDMLRIAEQLPPGEQHPPSEKLTVQWYYMLYHKSDRTEYVKSGKNLRKETLESLTSYFQALFSQKKADGSLKRAELDRIRNRAKQRLARDQREKREGRRTNYARCEIREQGQRNRS